MAATTALVRAIALLGGGAILGCSSPSTEAAAPSFGTRPPAQVADAPVGDGSGHAYAMTELLLGDRTRQGALLPGAWKQFGYDLDGTSLSDGNVLCQPVEGASAESVHEDGDNGIDNAFGKLVLPLIKALAPEAGDDINGAIQQGAFSLLLDIPTLGFATSYSHLPASLFGGGSLASPPSFDGSDQWPVVAGSSSELKHSYMSDHVFVASEGSTITLPLTIGDTTLELRIDHAIVTLRLNEKRDQGYDGVIAGVLDTNAFIAALRTAAGNANADLCGSIDVIADDMQRASDILKDGSQDPSRTCDGISIGLGFNALPTAIGQELSPKPALPNPCGD